MLTKIWTTSLLLGLAASLVALAFACMRVKTWGRFSRQPWGRRIAIAAFVVGMWVYASVKPGDGGSGGDGGGVVGTNDIQTVVGPVGGLQQMDLSGEAGSLTGLTGLTGLNHAGTNGNPVNPVQDVITSTNTTRTLAAEDFVRGFVMTRVGTNEKVDFSAPSNAVVCADWHSFGAAEDWIYVAMTNWMFKVGIFIFFHNLY